MERIVMKRRTEALKIWFIVAAVFFIVGIMGLLSESPNTYSVMGSLILFIVAIAVSICAYLFMNQKERLVMDDSGITMNDTIKIGPIPWDCISGAISYRLKINLEVLNI